MAFVLGTLYIARSCTGQLLTVMEDWTKSHLTSARKLTLSFLIFKKLLIKFLMD